LIIPNNFCRHVIKKIQNVKYNFGGNDVISMSAGEPKMIKLKVSSRKKKYGI